MRSDNYITIQGWMRTELNLKGNELLVYALIYSFSQVEGQHFTASLQYIADWCGCTKQGVIKNLDSLIQKGLVKKERKAFNIVEYSVQLSLINNNNYNNLLINNSNNQAINNQNNQIENNLEQKTEPFLGSIKTKSHENQTDRVVKFVELYESYPNLPRVRVITPARHKAILRMLNKQTEEDIREVLNNFNTSDFLLGRTSDFKANIDWIVKENNFIKVLEGKYNNNSKQAPKTNIKREDNAISEAYTEEELKNLQKIDEERRANGLRTEF